MGHPIEATLGRAKEKAVRSIILSTSIVATWTFWELKVTAFALLPKILGTKDGAMTESAPLHEICNVSQLILIHIVEMRVDSCTIPKALLVLYACPQRIPEQLSRKRQSLVRTSSRTFCRVYDVFSVYSKYKLEILKE